MNINIQDPGLIIWSIICGVVFIFIVFKIVKFLNNKRVN